VRGANEVVSARGAGDVLDEHVWHRFDHDLARIVRLNQLEEEVLYLLPDLRAVF
jgi:hypothetical protein